MTVRNVILWSLLIPLILSAIILRLRSTEDGVDEIIIPMGFCFALWGTGVFIGLFLSAVIKRPKKEPWFYVIGQALPLLIIGFISVVSLYKKMEHEKNFGNVEDNHRMVELDREYYSNTPEFIKTAFRKLESGFTNQNDFKIESFLTEKKDTTYRGYSETIYYVYFTYKIKKEGKYFSKIRVFIDSASIEILHENTRFSNEYVKIQAQMDSDRVTARKTIKEVIKALKDSNFIRVLDSNKLNH